MACLDTTVFLDLAGRGGATVREQARQIIRQIVADGEGLTTTRLNVAELYVGVARSARPQRELERIQRWLADVAILEFDDPAAQVFGALVGELLTRGTPVGDIDALIASVAIRNDQTVITRNVRHFQAVPGLKVTGY
ncbi:MAG: type II toxin-antitoxin system VapC family toxin [Phycisphaerales bacterium]|nr:type II toxin-antitoxin system VapC family toxin [Phycisphaerales bacterium]